eukprot:CAMPEP_0197048990 /NCGR_PEP_ID=MMETSP1384-20130603/24240_1 /TAXON_ID=29189 /ORGANISM="Ammonia sp." /LENGTH=365 /DNA_ID=CAMNT_0042481209 /DNA_START=1 /DNA_END=1098 /DNA_ORIENTATION=+
MTSQTQTQSEVAGDSQTASQSRPPPTPQYDPGEAVMELRNAIKEQNETMIAFLLEEHSDIDLVNILYLNQTPLQYAISNYQHAMIKYLLENGADPDIANETGNTALHIATLKGNKKAVELLCTHNANKSIKNHDGETAMDIALEQDTKRHRDILFLLEPNKKKLLKIKQTTSSKNVDKLTVRSAENWAESILTASPDLNEPSNAELNAPMTTVRLGGVVDDLFHDIQEDFMHSDASFHEMSGWLEKKQEALPYSWMKRWVVVREKYLLWSDRELSIETEHIDAKEKKRWNKCVALAKVTKVEERTDKKGRVFCASVKGRDYLFRAKDEKKRDEWMQTLRENLEYIEKMQMYAVSPSPSPMAHHSD